MCQLPGQPPLNARWDSLGNGVTIATLATFIAQMFGAATRGAAITFLAALVVFSVFRYLLAKKPEVALKWRGIPVNSSSLIALVLLAILFGTLLRQWSINSKTIDLGDIADTFHWRVWFCFGRQECIADAVTKLANRVTSESGNPPDQLFADQALGAIVRTSPPSEKLLKSLFGVYDDQFLGTGESLPPRQSYSSARIPEYLVPNYRDSHPGVLVWKIRQGASRLNEPLTQLLQEEPINQQPSVQMTRNNVIHDETNEDRPSLVRFAMIPSMQEDAETSGGPKTGYSGCFGLPERRLVFFSDLNYMIKNASSVLQAANFSGYKFDPQRVDQFLYVFMFAPSSSDECLGPSTWRNILNHVNSELSKQSVCK